MTRFETLTLLIAVITVVVSVVKLFHARHKKDELTRLQLRPPLRVHVPRADVIIDLESSDRGKNWWHEPARFVIMNWGHGAARNVDLRFKLRPGQHDPLVPGGCDQKFPIPELRPFVRVTLLATLTCQTGHTFDVTLTWTDPDGSVRHKDDQVSVRCIRSYRIPCNTTSRDMPCHCAAGWICAAHPDRPWPHHDCDGPEMQCDNSDCSWWKGSMPALTGGYCVVQPFGRDKVRESAIISEHLTAADAFAEIDQLAAQMVRTGAPSDAIELLVIDQAGEIVQRPGAH